MTPTPSCAAARQAANEAQRLNALLDVLDEGVAVCTGMQAVAVNTSLCRLIGIERDDAQHLMISSFIGDADVIERLLGEASLRLDTDITNRDGATIAVEIAARTIAYGEGAARLLEFRDVGERKHTQQRVSFLAHHDPLTSLPNRELMRARLAEAVERATATGTSFAVIWIDLDHFKDINDIHGHVVGDQILRIVAEKLKFEMPADTLIARLGGDEFVVLCEDINDALEARLIGQQLRRLLNRPIEVGEKSLVGRRLDRRRGLSGRCRQTPKTCSRTPTSRSITPRPKAAAAAAISPRSSAKSASAAWC